MRDLVLLSILTIPAFWAIRQPWIGVLLFLFISVMNPHRLTYGFMYNMPIAAIAAAFTLAGVLLGKQKARFPFKAPTIIIIIFIAWMGITTILAIHPDTSFEYYIKALKSLVLVLIALSLIQEKKHVHTLLWVFVLSIGYYGVKGGIYTIATAGSGRVWGPPDSLVFGNNEIAVAFVMAVPLMYYLSTTLVNKWHQRAMFFMITLTTIAALGTQSRGALLAVVAMGGMFWSKSPHKFRIAVAGALFAITMLPFMPDAWWARMETIGTYQTDDSAMGRVNAWLMAINIAFDRITGAGFDTATPLIYELYSPRKDGAPLVAHSIYFQVLGDHGFIGLFLFLALWITTYLLANNLKKITRDDNNFVWIRDLGRMTQVSLVGFFVGGAFLSLAYWDAPYYLIVIVIALNNIAKQRTEEAALTTFKKT